jgi:hypothetical protein
MPLSIRRTVDATTEPLTLSEAKSHLRIDDADTDSEIASHITAARIVAEKLTGRQFLTATWEMALDAFPGQWSSNARFAGPILQNSGGPTLLNTNFWCDASTIKIPNPPLQSVSSIVYIDTAGASQTWSSANYVVDATSEPGRIGLSSSASWPATQNRINAVTITYLAGWTGSTLPANVKHLLRLMVADYFENRVGTGDERLTAYSRTIQSLMDSLSIGDYR